VQKALFCFLFLRFLREKELRQILLLLQPLHITDKMSSSAGF